MKAAGLRIRLEEARLLELSSEILDVVTDRLVRVDVVVAPDQVRNELDVLGSHIAVIDLELGRLFGMLADVFVGPLVGARNGLDSSWVLLDLLT